MASGRYECDTAESVIQERSRSPRQESTAGQDGFFIIFDCFSTFNGFACCWYVINLHLFNNCIVLYCIVVLLTVRLKYQISTKSINEISFFFNFEKYSCTI